MGGTRLAIDRLAADKTEPTSTALLISDTADFGAYVELIPSTSIFTNFLMIFIHDNNVGLDYEIEIAKGQIGSEETIIPKILYHVNLTGQNIVMESMNFKVEIPEGTRLSARVKATTNTDEIEIHCVEQGT